MHILPSYDQNERLSLPHLQPSNEKHNEEEDEMTIRKETFKLDDETVKIMMFRSSKSLIVEMITDDQEALDLTQFALWIWFKEKGLSEGTNPPPGVD